MGLIRLLLALAVVAGHFHSSRFLKFTGGQVAVEAFFMISGFYMAMIIENYDSKAKFWSSRFLRLYPTYLFCALLALIVGQRYDLFAQIAHLPLPVSIYMALTNLTIFFQDVAMFIGVNGQDWYFTKSFENSSPPLYQLLLIPQAWSLGLELTFYMLAPWLLRKRPKVLIGIFIGSVLIRLLLKHYGLKDDPWSYRFFPSEIAFFLLGSLMFYRHRDNPPVANQRNDRIWLAVIVLAIVSFPFIHMNKILFYGLLAYSMGRIFDMTKNHALDNTLGALSYPIYCCHVILIQKFVWAHDGGFFTTLLAMAFVTLLAYLIYIGLEKPVDAYRRRRFKSAAPGSSTDQIPAPPA